MGNLEEMGRMQNKKNATKPCVCHCAVDLLKTISKLLPKIGWEDSLCADHGELEHQNQGSPGSSASAWTWTRVSTMWTRTWPLRPLIAEARLSPFCWLWKTFCAVAVGRERLRLALPCTHSGKVCHILRVYEVRDVLVNSDWNTYNCRRITAVKQKCCVEVEEHWHLLLLLFLCIHPNIYNYAKRQMNKTSECFWCPVVGKGPSTPLALVISCVNRHPWVSKCTFFRVQPPHRPTHSAESALDAWARKRAWALSQGKCQNLMCLFLLNSKEKKKNNLHLLVFQEFSKYFLLWAISLCNSCALCDR